ncbi:MAG: ligase [Gammaproteobacteria bacterium]|jgi:bifunctional non-homologous end joining protein LigD|nr:ligase [Gammaproteobacteria bacterium]
MRSLLRVPGATRAPHPGFVEPCLATLRDRVPSGDQWLHEIKYDGYRTQAHLIHGKPVIYTRRGYDWSDKFASITRALPSLPARDSIFDGEVVVPDARGISDFHKLQEDLARRRTDRLAYYIFDLLYLDGVDLRAAPLAERKRLLGQLLHAVPAGRIRLSEHIEAEGAQVFAHACAMHLEGIICKARDAPYRSGRQESWIKVKCTKSGTYPIVAFVEKLGARPRRVASLYLGRREGDRLLYAGKARSGYTETVLRDLRERLDPLIRSTSPLSVPVKKPKATWVEPELSAEVQYSALTSDGLLREPVFKGVRADLATSAARAPASSSAPKSVPRPATYGSVPKENILQLLPEAVVPTKEQLAAYWRKVAERALRYLGRRPLKLVRHVHGTTFYHKGPLPPIPAAVRQLKVQKREGGQGTRLWVEDLPGLLGLVEIGAIELHPWNATVDDIEHPDLLVFDLDPGEGIEWSFVVDSALALRELLRAEGLASWPKLTGGKGLHLMVPIKPDMTHDAAHRYSRVLAQRMAASDPRRYTVSAAIAARSGRLFIDYLRNGRGTTAIGTYSPRAREGFPIAAPVTWKQVENGIRPDAYTLSRLPGRALRAPSENNGLLNKTRANVGGK